MASEAVEERASSQSLMARGAHQSWRRPQGHTILKVVTISRICVKYTANFSGGARVVGGGMRLWWRRSSGVVARRCSLRVVYWKPSRQCWTGSTGTYKSSWQRDRCGL